MKIKNPKKMARSPMPSDGTANEIDVSEIIVDPAIQGRVAISPTVVFEYEERMAAGDKFPPLELFNVEGKLLLVDGAHRLKAVKYRREKRVACIIHDGTRLDAIKFALGTNRGHGLQRTNKDKRRCAEIALREFPQLSDGSIAEICGVSDRFVNGVRRHSRGNGSDLTRTGRDGKKYRLRHRPPTAALADKLPNFKLPPDPMEHAHALSTYFTGLAEQICVPICKYPAFANPIKAAMYAMFGEVLKRINQIQAIGDSSPPAPQVADLTGESQLHGASAPPGIEDAKIK